MIATSYLCKIKNGEPKIMEPDKASDMKWFSLDKLPDKLTITTKKALEDYNKLNKDNN